MTSGCPFSQAVGTYIKRPSILDRNGIYKCWFISRGRKNQSPRRKTSQSREENQQQQT